MPLHLGKDKYFFHYISENKQKTGKNKALFGLGMPPVTGGKTGKIKSLHLVCFTSDTCLCAFLMHCKLKFSKHSEFLNTFDYLQMQNSHKSMS